MLAQTTATAAPAQSAKAVALRTTMDKLWEDPAKAGDKAKLTAALNAWYANANQIAAFLSRANPHSWPLPMMRAMMKQHLALTTKEAVARLQGNWEADVAAYDQVHAEILHMSAMLSDGIIRQFPARF